MKQICSKCGKSIKYGTMCSCNKKHIKEYNKKYRSNVYKEAKKFLSTKEWTNLREQIIERDGYVCQRCLIKYNIITTSNLQGHHIKSRSHYPELQLEPDNIICICKTCNIQLGTSDKLDFEWVPPKIEEEKDYIL